MKNMKVEFKGITTADVVGLNERRPTRPYVIPQCHSLETHITEILKRPSTNIRVQYRQAS
jgi:hypothetical protein